MANIALYRKYRPRSFAEVVGQEHVTDPLIAALRNGRLNHAYLFSGPRGCGKTSSARILARSVNCAQGPTPEPCGVCESCRALAPDGSGSIDVIEIDAASHGGVDDARELREKAFFAPVNSRYKVYVIDEAHMVSSAGFNALLKLVEEPPEYVMFVFATTEPDKVLGTIRSRTHHYPFRLVPPGALRGHLERVCASEGSIVEPAVFPLVVKAGGGSVRDSMSILDQLLAGAGEEGVTYQSAVSLLGVTDVGLIDAAVDALAAADGAALFSTVDRVVEAGHDPRRFAVDLLERLRDLIVLNQVSDAAAKGLLDVPADELETLTGQALRLGAATLSRMADILHEGLAAMRGATSPRLVLELLCAQMLLPGEGATDLLARMETLERRMAAGVPATFAAVPPAPAAPVSAPPVSAPQPPAPPAPTPPAAAAAPVSAAPVSTPSVSAAPVSAPPSSAPPAPAQADRPAASSEQAPTSAPTSGAPAQGAAPTSGAPAGAQGAAPTPPPPQAPVQVPAQVTGPPGTADFAALERGWPQVLADVKTRSRMVWAILQNAAPFSLEGDTLVLKARNVGTAARLNDDAILTLLLQSLNAVLGVRWRIRCEANPSPSGGPRGGGAPSPPPAAAPEPPRSAPSQAPEPVSAPPAAPETDGWPTIARPGGESAPPPAPPAPRAEAPPASRAEAAPQQQEAPAPAQARTATATMDRPAPAEGLPDGPTDFSPDDPIPPTVGYDQFAPGDEPLDVPLDESVAPPPPPSRSREEQALELLTEGLGAEKIN